MKTERMISLIEHGLRLDWRAPSTLPSLVNDPRLVDRLQIGYNLQR